VPGCEVIVDGDVAIFLARQNAKFDKLNICQQVEKARERDKIVARKLDLSGTEQDAELGVTFLNCNVP
jgi:hypothetical protein